MGRGSPESRGLACQAYATPSQQPSFLVRRLPSKACWSYCAARIVLIWCFKYWRVMFRAFVYSTCLLLWFYHWIRTAPQYSIGNDAFAVCFSWHVESKSLWHTHSMLIILPASFYEWNWVREWWFELGIGRLAWQGLQFWDESRDDDLSGAGISPLWSSVIIGHIWDLGSGDG